ncbi:hypothetical protein EWM64_g4450 [Hericium alpestre]|uniref:F-box domain-containing protein n=1 Tax=Hericium alpestre TaxID=135208 RepID=A0A4Y9ZZT5_9AGAM|nr:hypothetical protein EWM64_g4450 [Hericium alpestre]
MSTSSYDDHDKLCHILYDSWESSKCPMRSVKLPNLRHLDWCIEECDDTFTVFTCIVILAGPRFKSLNMSLPKLPEDRDSSFHALTGFNIEYLQLQAGYDNSWPYSGLQISTLLCYLRTSHINLREEPTCDVWLYLSMLSQLHTLEGHFVPTNTNMSKIIAAILSGPISILQFPVLRHLTWTVYALDEYTALLRGFAKCRDLQTVGVELYQSNTPPELSAFFDALRASCSQDALTFFSMEHVDGECCHDEDTWISPTFPASRLLRPLLTFGAIEVCKITCCMAAWDDELLKEISIAWPNLKDLRLRTGHAPCTSMLTLPGLKPLARNCSRIKHVELEVGTGSSAWTDGMEIPKRDWNHGSGSTSRTSVDVSYHPQPDGSLGSEAMARRFLEAIFPCADIRLNLDDHLKELEEASS